MEGEDSTSDNFQIHVQDGIIYTSFSENYEIKLDVAKKLVQWRVEIQGSSTMPLMLDFRNLKSIDKESRDFLAEKSNNIYISAAAILVKSEIQRLLGMIFVFYYSVSCPYKVFEDERKALNWLNHFKNIN